jgi:ATP-binding cassette subfamily F protein 3
MRGATPDPGSRTGGVERVADQDPGEAKARKRVEAERRQSLSRERRPLERSLKKLETRLDELQRALADSEARLGDPSLYADGNKAELTAELQRRGELQTELAYIEKMWLEVGEELEQIGVQ